MTLENLVVYGGIVLGIWLIGILALEATARQRHSMLRLGMRHRTEARGTRRSIPGPASSVPPPRTSDGLLTRSGNGRYGRHRQTPELPALRGAGTLGIAPSRPSARERL